MSIRAPQRQNSISIADSEVPTQSWTAADNPSPSSNKDTTEKRILPLSSTAEIPLTKYNSNDNTPSVSIPKVFQKPIVPLNKFTSDNKPSSPVAVLKKKTQDMDQIPKPSPSPNNKSEALLERKIRIFSKFLANLGNLSKSIPDTDTDNKHKSNTRDQKSSATSDKRTRTRSFKVSCPAVQSRKHSNPPPEFDQLINLLKSMDCNRNPGNRKVPAVTTEVTELSKGNLQKSEYPVYESSVLLQTEGSPGEAQHRSFKPMLYTSSVSLYINAEDKMDIPTNRNETLDYSPGRDRKREEPSPVDDTWNSSPQMSFKGVSKEIEDLQLSIQKAKEMRICASKELHLLQELLSLDSTDENHEEGKEKRSTAVDSDRCSREAPFTATHATSKQALTDLREKSKKEMLEDTSFWQEEIRRVKEETKQAWQSKLERLESRLSSQEEELRRLQGDNDALHRHMESPPACHQCSRSEGGQQNGRTDSAFEDDEEYLNHKPPIPIQSTRQECERLQQRLVEEEQRADQLNLMLNQKLIELNKIQITLSNQTKEMIELEKSYLQLQCRLRRGTSKPVVARLCSRSSPFSSKNLYPKPSPPASPQPTNGAS